MAFTDILTAIETHATTAGAGLTNPITNVRIGYPKAAHRSARIFWGGETAPVRLGDNPRVLNGELVSDTIVVIVFWSLSNLSDDLAEIIELEARAFTAAFRTAVLGDSQLGGQSTDLEVGYGETDFPVLAGAAWRTLTFEIVTDFSEYALAP
jgi:hypothetical protein